MFRPYVDTRDHLGQTMKLGEAEVTPQSRATIVRVPGFSGGLVWSRPAGVLVQWNDDTEALLPIRDVTRIGQVALLALGLLGGIAVWLLFGRGD